MKYSALLVSFALLVACSSAPSESQIQTAVAQTQAAQPTEVPTMTAEQLYVSSIEPALNDLKEWISGPLSAYDVLLTHEEEGWSMSGKHPISFWLYNFWRIGPYGGDFESESYKFCWVPLILKALGNGNLWLLKKSQRWMPLFNEQRPPKRG